MAPKAQSNLIISLLTHLFPMHRKVFWCFQGVEKGWIGNKLVKISNNSTFLCDKVKIMFLEISCPNLVWMPKPLVSLFIWKRPCMFETLPKRCPIMDIFLEKLFCRTLVTPAYFITVLGQCSLSIPLKGSKGHWPKMKHWLK